MAKRQSTNWKERADSANKSARRAREAESFAALLAVTVPTGAALAAPSIASVAPGPSPAQLTAMAKKPGLGQVFKSVRVYGPLALAGALAYWGGRGKLARVGAAALGGLAGAYTVSTSAALRNIRAGHVLTVDELSMVAKVAE